MQWYGLNLWPVANVFSIQDLFVYGFISWCFPPSSGFLKAMEVERYSDMQGFLATDEFKGGHRCLELYSSTFIYTFYWLKYFILTMTFPPQLIKVKGESNISQGRWRLSSSTYKCCQARTERSDNNVLTKLVVIIVMYWKKDKRVEFLK